MKKIVLRLLNISAAPPVILMGAGFVMVHFAAYFLYTAIAPYLGSALGILGLATFMAGQVRRNR